MKKLLLLIMIAIFSLNVYAHGGASAIRGVRWTPVNIVTFPIALFDPEETEVYGILFSPGMGMSAKNVYGVNLGIATLLTGKCYGASRSASIPVRIFSFQKLNPSLLASLRSCTLEK